MLGHFLAATAAVAYAHGQGVLHRDLKPSNMILGPLGQAVVLDWGLGKSASSSEGERARSPENGTSPSARDLITQGQMGTLGYMSPEQQAGDWHNVTAKSDVYSLGVTLYYLLTGKPPFPGESRAEVAKKVEKGEFEAPRQRKASIPRALEAICLKAMSVLPNSRYPSAFELFEDLKDWMADEPVSAWNEPLRDRARRWLARRRTLVVGLRVASAAALLLIVAFAVVLVWSNRELAGKNQQLREAALARDNLIHDLQTANREVDDARGRAENRLELALSAIEKFRSTVAGNLDVKNRPDLKTLRKTLLEAPLEFFRQLKSDMLTSNEAHPEGSLQLARAISSLAEITAEIDSQPQAKVAYEETIEILGNLAEKYPGSPIYQKSRARALVALGRLQRNSGQDTLARASFEQALRALESMHQNDPDSVDLLADLASTLDALGMVMPLTGEVNRSLGFLDRALQAQRLVVEKQPHEVSYRTALAVLHNHLGVLQAGMGQSELASASFKEAIGIEEAAEREQASVAPVDQARLATFYFNCGNHTSGAHFATERMFYYGRCRQILERLVHEHPSVNQYRAELARIDGAIAVNHRVCGQFAEALSGFAKVRDLLASLCREYPEIVRHREDLAVTINNIAEIHVLLKRPGVALPLYEESRAVLEGLVALNPRNATWQAQLGEIWEGTGDALERLGRNEEAVAGYRRAIESQGSADKLGPPTRPYLGTLLRHIRHLARLQRSLGRVDDAVANASQYRTLSSHDSARLFQAAVEFALCIPLASANRGQTVNSTPVVSTNCSDLAVQTLSEAIDAGFRDVAKLVGESAFDSLRSRHDFQRSVIHLMDLAFPADPFHSQTEVRSL